MVGRYVCGVICEPHTWLVGGLARFSSAGVGHALVHRLSVGARAREGNIGNMILIDVTRHQWPIFNLLLCRSFALVGYACPRNPQRLVYLKLFFSL